jgi:hypothetical protein
MCIASGRWRTALPFGGVVRESTNIGQDLAALASCCSVALLLALLEVVFQLRSTDNVQPHFDQEAHHCTDQTSNQTLYERDRSSWHSQFHITSHCTTTTLASAYHRTAISRAKVVANRKRRCESSDGIGSDRDLRTNVRELHSFFDTNDILPQPQHQAVSNYYGSHNTLVSSSLFLSLCVYLGLCDGFDHS